MYVRMFGFIINYMITSILAHVSFIILFVKNLKKIVTYLFTIYPVYDLVHVMTFVFSDCLQLAEDVKAVDGHQPHRRLRKKVHHRLLLRPNQPGRLSRSEARYKHGIVCDFIILFSWNNHDVFTKFSILFPVLYVFRLFFWLLSTWE